MNEMRIIMRKLILTSFLVSIFGVVGFSVAFAAPARPTNLQATLYADFSLWDLLS